MDELLQTENSGEDEIRMYLNEFSKRELTDKKNEIEEQIMEMAEVYSESLKS